ncbi:hypothetical protein SUGI_0101790 [Cryptomeria japonica]|nr:hypothetical protein SUGI_0101790 [Cryptomeria japonica]
MFDLRMQRRFSSDTYFPRVRGGINRVKGISHGVPPPSIGINGTIRIDIPAKVNHEATSTCFEKESQRMAQLSPEKLRFTQDSIENGFEKPYDYQRIVDAVASAAQANRTPSPPSPRPLRDITVRSKIPYPVSPFPNAYHQTLNDIVEPTISNENSGPGHGKKGSYSLWGRILNVVKCVMDPCNEKSVRLGKNSLIVLVCCFVLRQAYNMEKGGVNRKLQTGETITISKGRENVLRGRSCENVVSDQNNNSIGVFGYLSIIAVKGLVGMGRIVSHLFISVFCFVLRQACNLLKFLAVKGVVGMGKILSKLFCFLHFVFYLSKRVVMGSGRKTLDACGVILSQCFSHLHFIIGQIAVRFGRMGILVSEFCVQKFWELLKFIKCQAFGFPGEMIVWSQVKMQDALSYYLKELLRKVVCTR